MFERFKTRPKHPGRLNALLHYMRLLGLPNGVQRRIELCVYRSFASYVRLRYRLIDFGVPPPSWLAKLIPDREAHR